MSEEPWEGLPEELWPPSRAWGSSEGSKTPPPLSSKSPNPRELMQQQQLSVCMSRPRGERECSWGPLNQLCTLESYDSIRGGWGRGNLLLLSCQDLLW